MHRRIVIGYGGMGIVYQGQQRDPLSETGGNDVTSSDPRRDKIFVSYSSKDKQWADAACRVLEAKGLRCWIAPRDIVPGAEWGSSIISGIDTCAVMVVIFSDNANQSPQVRREVERAMSKGLVIMPCRVEDVRPVGALEYALSNTHWLDVFTPPLDEQMERMAEAVQIVLAALHPQIQPSPVVAPRPAATTAPVKGNACWTWILSGVISVCLSLVGGLMVFQRMMSAFPKPQPGGGFKGQAADFDKSFNTVQELALCGLPINLLFWGGCLAIIIGLVLLSRGTKNA